MKTIETKKIPVHELVYRQLRDKILFGELAPGQPVTIYGLVDELEVGMTPVREAIRRLTAEGALVFQGNRRVSLPDVGEREFLDIAFARRAVEPELVKLAAQRITPAGIAKMREMDALVDVAIEQGNAHDYMKYNHKFHFTLYAAAESELLHSIVSMLWLRYGPLYRIISGKWGTAQLVDCHDQALNALEKGDVQGTCDAMLGDIEQGFQIVQNVFGWKI